MAKRTKKVLSYLELRPGATNKATPGPWRSFVEGRDHTSGSNFIMTGQGDDRHEDIELSGATIEDQDFIAAPGYGESNANIDCLNWSTQIQSESVGSDGGRTDNFNLISI